MKRLRTTAQSTPYHLGATLWLFGLLLSSVGCAAGLQPTETHSNSLISSGSDPGGVLITGTVRVRDGGELELRERAYISQLADLVASRHIGIDRSGRVTWARQFVSQGNRMFQVMFDRSGEAISLSGHDISVVVPALVRPFVTDPSRGEDRRVRDLINYVEHPRAHMEDVVELLAAHIITQTAVLEHLGTTVREYYVDLSNHSLYPTVSARVWLTSEGYKLKVERWLNDSTGEADVIFIGEAMQIGLMNGEGYFRPDVVDVGYFAGITTDYAQIEAFDPGSNNVPEVTEAGDLLYPVTVPVSDTFVISSSIFITGTMDSRLMEGAVRPWDGVMDNRKWWVVEELVDSSSEVVVIQGPSTQEYSPIDMPEIWPPAWNGVLGTTILPNVYVNGSTGVFSNTLAFDLYEIAHPDSAPARVWIPPYEYLLTWEVPGNVTIVMLSRGLSHDGIVSFAERFLDLSSLPRRDSGP